MEEGIIMKMKLRFPESEIDAWGNKYIIDLSENIIQIVSGLRQMGNWLSILTN